jgi:aromatic ring hydroxylase
MLRNGKEHLESLRDGRVVYIGSEKVDDVTRHPAFRNAAQTVAALYDMKAAPALRDDMNYEEDGGRHSIYFLRARSRQDLQRRMIGHRRVADFTYGMFGRSPDHVAAFVTGMAMKPDALEAPGGNPGNLLSYYEHIRDNDIYTVYAVLPPQAARNPEFYQRQNIPVPTLRVVREDASGVVMYGALEWCTQNYSKFVDDLRELCGGGVFQMPANISVMQDADLARQFQTFWQTPQCDALTRMKLFKLAWDMVGSEFAGRHQQYEKFYAGASFIVRNHMFRETDWGAFNKIVEDLTARYDHTDASTGTAAA